MLKKLGEYIKKLLSDKEYKAYLSSHTAAEMDQILESVLHMGELFE